MGHLRTLVFGPQEAIVDINGQLEVLTPADQAVHLKRKKRRWNAELFGNAEKVSVAGVNQIQHLRIIQQQIGGEEIGLPFQSAGGLIDVEILHGLTAEVV